MIVHLGAHKTASTHLQKSLLAQRDLLAEQNVWYLGPDRLRHDLRLPSLNRSEADVHRRLAPLREHLQVIEGRGGRILLSDENMLGRPERAHCLADGLFYPQAAPRIERLIRALGLTNATLALAIRNPANFIVSLHGHQALSGRLVDFGAFADGLDPLQFRWSELVMRLKAVPGVGQIVLWRYEDYARLGTPIAGELLGDESFADLFSQFADRPLTGVSAAALEHAAALVAATPGLELKQAIKRAMMRFPKSRRYPALDPFTPFVQKRSRRLYRSDWVLLQSLPGVTCLLP